MNEAETHYGVGEDGELIEVNDPGLLDHTVDKMHAIVAVDDKGGEGIIGLRTANGWLPMIAAEREKLERMLPIAKQMAEVGNKTIRLVEFSSRTVVYDSATDS